MENRQERVFRRDFRSLSAAVSPSTDSFLLHSFYHKQNSTTVLRHQTKMADSNGSASMQENIASDSKGKGKATEPETHDVSMEVDDSSSEEEIDEVNCKL
jgi:hypothetical protein